MRVLLLGLGLVLVSGPATAENYRVKAARLVAMAEPHQALLKTCLVEKTVQLGGENTTPLDELFLAAHQLCGREAAQLTLDVLAVYGPSDAPLGERLAGAVDQDARAQASLALIQVRGKK